MSNPNTVLFQKLFGDIPTNPYDTEGNRAGTLPMTDFCTAILPEQHEWLISLLNTTVPSWEGITAVVGLAERSIGTLVHGIALCRKLPYSLINWYPEGSIGDIPIEGGAAGFDSGNKGVVFLNGLTPKKDKIIFVDATLRKGTRARKVLAAARKAGVDIACVAVAACFENLGGKELIEKTFNIPVVSLCTVDASGPRTIVKKVTKAVRYRESPAKTVAEIRAMPLSEMKAKFERVLRSFVGVNVYRAKDSTYPYCPFALTDFQPLLDPTLVEDMADCMVCLSDFSSGDLLVSEADRGGGPLVIAVARRTRLPFTLAGWEAPMSPCGGVQSSAVVGYSGSGDIFLNGVAPGTRCIVIDDMLSSGGTAECLFKAITAAEARVVEAHFASEKVTTNGRQRLRKSFPDVRLFSLCYFEASGAVTSSVPPSALGNETPIQKHEVPKPVQFGKILSKVMLVAIAALYLWKGGM